MIPNWLIAKQNWISSASAHFESSNAVRRAYFCIHFVKSWRHHDGTSIVRSSCSRCGVRCAPHSFRAQKIVIYINVDLSVRGINSLHLNNKSSINLQMNLVDEMTQSFSRMYLYAACNWLCHLFHLTEYVYNLHKSKKCNQFGCDAMMTRRQYGQNRNEIHLRFHFSWASALRSISLELYHRLKLPTQTSKY